MDLLQNYKGDSSSDDETSSIQMEEINSEPRGIIMPLVNIAPHVVVSSPVQQAAVIDPKTKELYYNPKYEELFMPDVGPSNPFKSEHQKAPKNTLTGFVEPAHFSGFHFDRAIRSYDTLGYAENPSADAGGSSSFVGDVESAHLTGGRSLFESAKTGGQKRKRIVNYDASDIDGYTGPWARFEDQKIVAKPDPELQKEMDEYIRFFLLFFWVIWRMGIAFCVYLTLNIVSNFQGGLKKFIL
ncbi:unnamed protein product [Meloidogyne enterolobii]|uniref:Uncharacterized protein n=2 Tax=Meloidogyne enterolobii TaxID=390850 RepID=A0ACB0XN95_MELEN